MKVLKYVLLRLIVPVSDNKRLAYARKGTGMTNPQNKATQVATSLLVATIAVAITVAGSLHAADKKKPAGKPSKMQLIKTFAAEFVDITPGKGKFPKSFEMGSKTGSKTEQPAHRVTFGYSFAMAKYEMPQNLYEAVMGANPSRWKGPRNSVEMMTWAEANTFCKKTTTLMRDAKLIAADEEIRIPTESEWEYCCRAGTTTEYSFGDEARKKGDAEKKTSILDIYAWHTGNAAGNDPPVGAKKPNAWGLYDVHGYLSELVADDWIEGYTKAPSDGTARKSDAKNVKRVVRSGSWKDRYENLRSATRISVPGDTKDDAIGFRCVKAKIVGQK